jgi:hypothetical protein
MSEENLDDAELDQESAETEQPDVTDSPESVQDDAVDGDDTAEKPKKTGFQKRIDELTREKYEAQAQAKFFAEQLKSKETSQPATPANAAPAVAPKADDFDTYEEFIDALSDWKVDQKLAAREAATQAKAADNSKAEAQRVQATSMQARIAEGRDKYDDFDHVALNQAIPITQDMALAVADSEVGADLAYYLGSHLDEAARISQMTPSAQYRAIGKLEAKLESRPVQTAEKSKAPTPIKPVAKGAKATIDPNSMSIDEWMEWRKKTG